MKKELLLKYIFNLLKDFDNQIKLARRGAKEEPVHDLRVLIKRLKALFLFLDEANIYKNNSNSYFNQLKQFFRSAGNLRDVQIHISLVRDYKASVNSPLDEYETYLINKEQTARQSFFKVSTEYPVKEQIFIRNEIISAIKKFEQDKLNERSHRFLVRRLNRIEKYLFHTETQQYLHKIRKTLKELRFFLEVILICSERNPMEDVDFTQIKEIESVLGKWNDCFMLTEDLKRYSKYKQQLNASRPTGETKKLIKVVRNDMNIMVTDIKLHLLKLSYHLKFMMI